MGEIRVDLNKLKLAMLDNFDDLLLDVLEDFGFKNPRMKFNDYIQCGYEDSSSGNSVIIKKSDTKIISFKRYSTGAVGDIIDLLLGKVPKEDAGKTIFKLYNIFKGSYDNNEDSENQTLRKSYLDTITSHELTPNEYDIISEDRIGEPCISTMFLKSNILPSIQLEFRVWENVDMDRICVNWRDIRGNLIGSVGRYNGKASFNKYLPIFDNFKKTLHLFGLYENLNNILKSKKVYVFEAEKSVLQTASYGHRLSVSTGFSNISANQLKLLKFCGVETVIFCPDEDIDIAEHIKQLKLNINNHGIEFKEIMYLYDKNKEFLDYKMSPADLRGDKYNQYIKSCLYTYEDIINMNPN